MAGTPYTEFPFIEPPPPVAYSTGRVLPRQISSGMQSGEQRLGGDKVIMDSANSKFSVFDDDDDERIRIGKQPDGSYNIIVTKPTYNLEDLFT